MNGPLFRVIHGRGAHEDRLLLVCHHLVCDGTSVSLLAERLIALAQGAAGLAEAPGFAAYQARQDSEVSAARHARGERFWAENLSGQSTPELGHWLRPAAGAAGRELRRAMPEDLGSAVRTCARDAEVSEFTLLLAPFGVVLGRYADAESLSVAIPSSWTPTTRCPPACAGWCTTAPCASPGRSRSWSSSSATPANWSSRVGGPEELPTFPEYMENAYSSRMDAPFPGVVDRSTELTGDAASARRAAEVTA